MRTILITIFLIFVGSHCVQAQLGFRSVSVQDGLSSSSITCVIKDHQGFIWVGTQDGLNRYDGLKIQTFRRNSQVNGLPGNHIATMSIDTIGRLWIGTLNNGIVLYHPESEKFISPKAVFTNEDVIGSQIRKILCHKDYVIVGSLRGLTLIDLKSGQASNYRRNYETGSISQNEVLDILHHQGNKFWITTNSGNLELFDAATGKFEQFGYAQNAHQGSRYKPLARDNYGKIWIGTQENGIFIFTPATKQFQNITTGNSDLISDVITDLAFNDESMLIATDGEGIQAYSYATKSFHKVLDNPMAQGKREVVVDVYRDDTGTLWCSTLSGLKVANPFMKKFKVLNNNAYDIKSLSSDVVIEVTADDDKIWIGTDGGGLNEWYPTSGNLKRYRQIPNSNQSIANDVVKTIFKDPNGFLWIGTYNGGLSRYNPITNTFRHFLHHPENPKSIHDNSIWDVISLDEKTLLVGTLGGLAVMDLETSEFTNYPSFSVMKILKTDSGKFYVGTSQGVCEFDAYKGQYKWFRQHGNDEIDLSQEEIPTLLQTRSGKIWVGTANGISLLEPADQTLRYLPLSAQLNNQYISSILEDQDGNLWVGTNAGLSKISLTDSSVINYGLDDGLPGLKFNNNASASASNGFLYFGCTEGLVYFDPSKVFENPISPKPVFTELHINGVKLNVGDTVNGRVILPQSLNHVTRITLGPKESYFRILFGSGEYTSPIHNQFRYKVEGLSDDWTYTTGNVNEASFRSLPPGEYRLLLESANNDGIWSTTPAVLNIAIEPPWYETSWFRIAAVIIFISVGLLYYRMRTRNLILQKERLKVMVEQKTKKIEKQRDELNNKNMLLNKSNKELEKTIDQLKEAQAQLVQAEKMASLGILTAGVSHEINNPLNFIRNGALLIERELTEKGALEDKLVPYLKAINEGVQRASNIVKSLDNLSKDGNDLEEKCIIENILDDCLLTMDSQFQNRVTLIKEYSSERTYIKGNKTKLYQAFLNILSNAEQAIIDKGEITVITFCKDQKHHTIISDDGIGIPKDHLNKLTDPFFTTKDPGKGTGLGLSITYYIIAEHKGSLEINSDAEKGTSVQISIPLNV